MIDDLCAARPQSGLSQADVVWHAPAEGGIPRYMALFQTVPRRSAPSAARASTTSPGPPSGGRSTCTSGGSPQALALLNSSKGRGKVVYNADVPLEPVPVPRRLPVRAPQRLHRRRRTSASCPAGRARSRSRDQAPEWSFAPDAPLEQRPEGGTIVVPYLANKITYNYDRKTNTYKRSVSVEGKQFDVGTKPKVRIAPKNVIVMRVRFVSLGDKKHRLDGQVTGSGTAWIATNGKTIKGTWRKKSFTAPTRFYEPTGTRSR